MLYFHYWRVWNSPKKYYENVLTGKSINNQKLPDRIKKINSDTSDSFGEITTISICFQLIINEYKKAFFFFYVYCLLRTCSISALHIFLSFFDLSNICHITITLKKIASVIHSCKDVTHVTHLFSMFLFPSIGISTLCISKISFVCF